MVRPVAGDRRNGDPGYRRPRVWIAGGLTVLLALLMVFDASSASYSLSELALTIMLGAILTLLGLEVTDIMRGGKP